MSKGRKAYFLSEAPAADHAESREAKTHDGDRAWLRSAGGEERRIAREADDYIVVVARTFDGVRAAKSPGRVFKAEDFFAIGEFEEREMIPAYGAEQSIAARNIVRAVACAGRKVTMTRSQAPAVTR